MVECRTPEVSLSCLVFRAGCGIQFLTIAFVSTFLLTQHDLTTSIKERYMTSSGAILKQCHENNNRKIYGFSSVTITKKY